MKVVRWLTEQGRPGNIFVFGSLNGVIWLSGRQSVSRFGFSWPLMMADGSAIQSEYRAEVTEALVATPPRYIVVDNTVRAFGKKIALADFPDLEYMVRRSYREVVRFGNITIHEIHYHDVSLGSGDSRRRQD